MKSTLGYILVTLAYLLSPFWAITYQNHFPFITQNVIIFLFALLFSSIAGFVFSAHFSALLFARMNDLGHKRCWILLVLTIGLIATLYINKTVLCQFMNSADEFSCYFFAKCLIKFRLWGEPPLLPYFFDTAHIGLKAGKWFSVYPIGWPLIWAVSIRLGISQFINPILACVSMFLLHEVFKKIIGSGRALVVVLVCVSSPFYLFTAASYYSHSLALFCIAGMIFAFQKWHVEENNHFVWPLLCAFSLCLGLMTRYLTVGAVALPFLLLRGLPIVRRTVKWTTLDLIFLVILSVGFFLVLLQNFSISGNFFIAPNAFDKPWERLGFKDSYTPLDGLHFVISRFFYLTDWVSPVFIFLYFVGFFSFSKSTFVASLKAVPLFLIAGYFLYFSWGGNQYGPRYYWEAIPFLGFGAVCGAEELQSKICTNRSRFFIPFLIFFGIATNVFLNTKQCRHFGEITRQRKSVYDLIRASTKKPCIVFLKGSFGNKLPLTEEDIVRNDPELDGPVLLAHDRGGENEALIKTYPGRTYYRAIYDASENEPKLEQISAGQ